MDYSLEPSLEHIVLVKIAVSLWSAEDIRQLWAPYITSRVCERRRRITQGVANKILLLPLPTLQEIKLLRFIHAVRSQLKSWMEFHHTYYTPIQEMPKVFYWTQRGTIDGKKTADMLIRNEQCSVVTRYRLACAYCLVNHIDTLWKQLGDGEFHNKNLTAIRQREPPLVIFWSHYTENKISELEYEIRKHGSNPDVTCYEYAFLHAVCFASAAGVRYFLQKLNSEEKRKLLVQGCKEITMDPQRPTNRLMHYNQRYYVDVLCFLLSVMTTEQQAEVFESYPLGILKCFLHWPMQDFFFETAERMYNFLHVEDFYFLLNKIFDKGYLEDTDYDYQKLFTDCWSKSPLSLRRDVIEKYICEGELLSRLFVAQDKENVKHILDSFSVKQKRMFIDRKGMVICEGLAMSNQWDLLKFFVTQFVSNESEMTEFKSRFLEHVQRSYSGKVPGDTLENLIQFLDDLVNEITIKRNRVTNFQD